MTVEPEKTWRLGPACEWPLHSPTIFSILNITPDSFSDGGLYGSPEEAAAAALRMVHEGAAIIDVGGESTRPGASRIAVIEQINRVVPVIELIRQVCDVPISIDTTRSEVAEAALDAGATIINDVSAGMEDAGMFTLAATRRCAIILMHRLAPPTDDSYSDQYAVPPSYDDVVMTVLAFLRERAQLAMEAGIAREAIAIDPGLGFGKSVEQNFELIARTHEFVSLGYPIMCGASRKSFIGKATGTAKPSERVHGSVAAALAMYSCGARLFRVHDVKAHREALAAMEIIMQSRVFVQQVQGMA